MQAAIHTAPYGDEMARGLIIIGGVTLVVGLLWPWFRQLGIGHLPGDIHIHGDGWSFYFPITTSIIVSLLISLVLWLLNR